MTSKKFELEIRRQLFHVTNGVIILLLSMQWPFEVGYFLILASVIGALLSLLHVRFFRIPYAEYFLNLLERKENEFFPGKGAILYGLGAGFVLVFFPKDIARASICALAFGDSFSTIFGKFLGNHPIPWNRKLTVEGSLGFIFATVLMGMFFADIKYLVMAAFVGALVETVSIVDDNISIPVVVSVVLGVVF